MSEFSIEEKANAYDLALKKAKTLLSKCKRVSDKASMIYRAEDIENMFPELQKTDDEIIREEMLQIAKESEDSFYMVLTPNKREMLINWLEKQEQSKKTSIWKHWKNGIAGNGEGKLVFLIKSGVTYSLSSCLSFECDYIELSELDNLMLEKQDNLTDIANKEYWRGYKEGKQEALDKYSELEKQSVQNINILWHDVSEEPEEQRELFCEWKGYTGVWYDVAFYHSSNKTFWNGEQQIENVVRWTYVDEILEKQFQSYIKPTKFKAGDTIQCISDETDKRTIAEIDTLYNVYRCENNYPIPFTQENMWKLI